MSEPVTAFAPASIGNLAVGFDMLGLALTGVGDRVSARRTDIGGISIAEQYVGNCLSARLAAVPGLKNSIACFRFRGQRNCRT